MQEYIAELSKYLITLFVTLYTFFGFLALSVKKEDHKKTLCGLQTGLLFVTQFFCFYTLYVKSGQVNYLIFYVLVQVFLFSALVMTRLIYENIDRLLLNHMCMLLGIGFVILSRLSMQKAVKQFAIVIISLIIGLFIPMLLSRMRFLPKLTWLYASVGLFALSAVLVMGNLTNGSKLSFSIADITFQPSEFVKLVFIFFLAAALCEDTSPGRLAVTTVIAAAHVCVLVVSRDLGSALIFFVAYVFVVFFATGSYLYLLLCAAAGCAGAAGSYFLFRHVRVRVLAWRDPFAYIDNQGYQITQSLFAIGSGGWFGSGLCGGTPGDIPYVETDFVFSAVCEELGVICGVCLILICINCFIVMLHTGMKSRNRFYRLVALGMGIIYMFQIFLTIGGGIKFIPLTGVTLPFISYGGSSVLTTMLLFFVVQGLHCLQAKRIPPRTGQTKSIRAQWERDNRNILAVLYAFVLLFLGMNGYLTYFVATNEQELINNSYNSRQEILLSRNTRGTIYAAGGEVLAQTVTEADGTEVRSYPYGEKFAHSVGFSTRGRSGLEAQANYYLINSDLPLTVKVQNDLAGEKNPGNNVYTTLDVPLQEAACRALDTYKGAVIVTEVSTGKILAMVSRPDFDPNEIADIWDDLVEDESSGVLVNRATQGLYPPGSTFKIITALAYIRQNPDTWDSYRFDCPGYYSADGSRINCYHGISHGSLDFAGSFAESCNSSFANIGTSLGKNDFADTLESLLFNGALPVDFSYAKSSITVDESLSTEEMMQAAIGQGRTQMTPLHLNMITAAVANDGVMMTPYLIDHVENAYGNVIKTFQPSSCGRVMSVEEAQILTDCMVAVVEEGTATRISGLSYTVAGKTGSAEYNNVKGDSHAWFTGFAPAEDPQICVTVILEGAGSGGDYAVPIARRVFDAWFN